MKKMSKAAAFKEVHDNPPKILAKTARKKGKAQAEKQRVAIALSKSGLSRGSNVRNVRSA